ncbi:MAG: DNA-binding protein [Streptococcus thermophilus]|uniref:DNA-binding protein n=2 Tax=root TaxID=1 RepID=A0A3G6JKE4_STRTR|nr:MAG: hypothetical protein PQF12_gp09 [Streptococcus phage VS-2018a]AZA18281.1 MAG: DNA-binding protein [Streptococcus thermophilus]AZA24379.1 MAG: hypothetical protein DF198_0045 [Streptococcus phage VS-2018a]
MTDPFKPLLEQFDSMLTTVIAEKSKAFDIDQTLPLILTAKQCQAMLGIGNYTEFLRVTNLDGFPKIDKGRGSQVRYPRDQVRQWFNNHWQDIA